MRTSPLALCALLLACPPNTGGTETSDSDTTGSTSGTTESPTSGDACMPLPAATDECCCFASADPTSNQCPTSEVCAAVTIECSIEDPDCPIPSGGGGSPGAVTVSDAAALDCILTAFRDGTPGQVSWTFQDSEGSGVFSRTEVDFIAADRSLFVSQTDVTDLDGMRQDLTRAPLKPAAYFTECLGQVDIKLKALCLKALTEGEAQVCAMGGPFDASV